YFAILTLSLHDALPIFFGFLLFVFGIILSLLLLFRRKPLLTITDNQIIIHNVIAKSKIVEIDNINSFFIVNNYHRGIATNRQIRSEEHTSELQSRENLV